MCKRLVIIAMLAAAVFLGGAREAEALYYDGGDGDGFSAAIGANGDVVSISSPAQMFTISDSTTAISAIVIEMELGQAGAGINTTDDIRVKIPAAVDMVWQNDGTAAIGGSASAKVLTSVNYEDSFKTLVISVSANFANGDYISVSELSFEDFNSLSFGNLELEIDNLGSSAATDNNRKSIGIGASSAVFTGGSGDGFDAAEKTHTPPNAIFFGINF